MLWNCVIAGGHCTGTTYSVSGEKLLLQFARFPARVSLLVWFGRMFLASLFVPTYLFKYNVDPRFRVAGLSFDEGTVLIPW